jgi:hypothetical protein
MGIPALRRVARCARSSGGRGVVVSHRATCAWCGRLTGTDFNGCWDCDRIVCERCRDDHDGRCPDHSVGEAVGVIFELRCACGATVLALEHAPQRAFLVDSLRCGDCGGRYEAWSPRGGSMAGGAGAGDGGGGAIDPPGEHPESLGAAEVLTTDAVALAPGGVQVGAVAVAIAARRARGVAAATVFATNMMILRNTQEQAALAGKRPVEGCLPGALLPCHRDRALHKEARTANALCNGTSSARVARTVGRMTVMGSGGVASRRPRAHYGRLLPCERPRLRRLAACFGATPDDAPLWDDSRRARTNTRSLLIVSSTRRASWS